MKRIIAIALVTNTIIFTTFGTQASEKFRLIGDQNYQTGEKFKETELGGLSGLVFDAKKNKLLVISDDKSEKTDARFYEFDLKLDDKSFSLSKADVITLKNQDGTPFPKDTADFEDIAILNGDLLITSEGRINKSPPLDPEVLVFGRDGKYKFNIDVPEKFKPMKGIESKSGVRDNLAFEALTVSNDGKEFWVGSEESLFQDGRTSGPKHASIVRLIQYKDSKPVKEVAYHLETVPSVSVAGLVVGVTGLSAIVAIDDSTFYSIERIYLPLARKTIVRIFKFKITDKTTDISTMDAIASKKITTVEKELIANLDDFTSSMSDQFKVVDNVEGICFGPKLANGHRTLIMVSDNNFSKRQRTQFLAFEIIP
ncbi:MAG: esterase-like activity of phytase family protein [Alphaproteobacteria bacterium]|nr:MAG: esterase-like activity of phytase family protein [Alphaproteobacteria bacterium]